MSIQGFDSALERRGTNSVKWDSCAPDELPLWVADMDFAPPACVAEAITDRLAHPALGYTFASPAWEGAVRSWCQDRQGWEPGRLFALQGVMTGLHGAILATSKPHDNVVIQPPVYHPFASIPPRLNRRVLEAPLRVGIASRVEPDGACPVHMEFDWAALESAFSQPETTTMILCSPHNPGGVIWDRSTLIRLGTLARTHGVCLVVDEIHADIVRQEGSFISFGRLLAEKVWGDQVPDVFIIQAPTKSFNIAGISSAWACASSEELFHRFEQMVRNLGTEVINILSYAAAEAVYTRGYPWLVEARGAIDQNLSWLHQEVLAFNRSQAATGKPCLAASMPGATYLYWLHVGALGGSDSRAFVAGLREAGLRLNPGAQFGTGGDGFVRINCATHPDILAAAWAKLRARLLGQD